MNKDSKMYSGYPALVTVVGVKYKDKVNYMAAAWHSYLSHTPPVYSVSISPKRFTHDMILRAGEFNCNFLPFDKVEAVHGTGRTSGKAINKIATLKLDTRSGETINAPFLSDAYAVLECKLIKNITIGDHTLFMGEIKNTVNLKGSLTETGLVNIEEISPVLYLGSDNYVRITSSEIKRLPREFKIS